MSGPKFHPELHFTQKYIRRLIFLLVIGIIISAFLFRDHFTDVEETVRTLGYPAVFVISLIGSAGMVLPLPSTAAIFFGGNILNPFYVGLFAGVAEAIGEITGYALGYSGSEIAKKVRFYPRIEHWIRTRGWLPIFIFSMIPNPIFDILGIAAGTVRYPLRRFLLIAWAGKTIKNIGIAYAGAVGVDWVRRFL